jgi:hypothetical protein
MKAIRSIIRALFRSTYEYSRNFPAKGRIISPAIKKRIPANCSGEVNGSPILIPTNADDHNKHAIIARTEVCKIKFFRSFPFSACKIR